MKVRNIAPRLKRKSISKSVEILVQGIEQETSVSALAALEETNSSYQQGLFDYFIRISRLSFRTF